MGDQLWRHGEALILVKDNGQLQILKKGLFGITAKRAGVTYRTYGEFADDGKANIPALEDHFCPYFSSYNN
ncbi:MAG: hypothetical protein WKF59_12280 [Chitinophagaceae bacterium]